MRMTLVMAAAALSLTGAAAPSEHVTLRLHYVQKPIGYEKYELVRDSKGSTLTADFDFTDRGGRVQLAATLQTQPDYTPTELVAKGKTYRFVNVDSHIVVNGRDANVTADGGSAKVSLPAQFYTVDGYAPFSAQMLMLRYWKAHGRPRTLATVPGLPVNEVIIESRGKETILGTPLERFVVDGVVWGRETIWLDERDGLAAAITRAGGLSFEGVREDLEPALVQFVESATRDRVADLESIATHTRRRTPARTRSWVRP
jgi:hypothetical protein